MQNMVISRCCFAEDDKEIYQELEHMSTALPLPSWFSQASVLHLLSHFVLSPPGYASTLLEKYPLIIPICLPKFASVSKRRPAMNKTEQACERTNRRFHHSFSVSLPSMLIWSGSASRLKKITQEENCKLTTLARNKRTLQNLLTYIGWTNKIATFRSWVTPTNSSVIKSIACSAGSRVSGRDDRKSGRATSGMSPARLLGRPLWPRAWNRLQRKILLTIETGFNQSVLKHF